MALTPKQRRLRKEIEDIASIFDMDHWNILDYKPNQRTVYLEMTKDKLIRGHIIVMYTMVDQLLSTAVCRYYFPARPPWVNKTFSQLWQMKQFKTFNHYLMDETYLMKKLSLVDAIKKVPKHVSSAISRINDVRNALAHGLFPEKRRRYSAHGKVMYQDADILSKDGVEKFEKDFDLVLRYLHGRAFGKKL